MTKIKKLFGQRIKELRKSRNLTQAQLAELVDVDNKHISCIENGKNFPSPKVLERLEDAFKLELKDLFDFSHLEESENLRKKIITIVENADNSELSSIYKFIKVFLLK